MFPPGAEVALAPAPARVVATAAGPALVLAARAEARGAPTLDGQHAAAVAGSATPSGGAAAAPAVAREERGVQTSPRAAAPLESAAPPGRAASLAKAAQDVGAETSARTRTEAGEVRRTRHGEEIESEANDFPPPVDLAESEGGGTDAEEGFSTASSSDAGSPPPFEDWPEDV